MISPNSNSGHPLKLGTSANGDEITNAYYTTYNKEGTPGSAGAYTEVKLQQDAPNTLYYFCGNHSGMGGQVNAGGAQTTLNDLSVTATATELNILDGVTSTTAELNILDGVTATTAELNILDGVTATAAELNITVSHQPQLN